VSGIVTRRQAFEERREAERRRHAPTGGPRPIEGDVVRGRRSRRGGLSIETGLLVRRIVASCPSISQPEPPDDTRTEQHHRSGSALLLHRACNRSDPHVW